MGYDSLNAPWTASAQKTRLSLLQRMNAEEIDELTWQEFFRKYSPFVIMMGKCTGLSREEIKELWSKVFVDINAKGIGAYDRSKGSFRSWFKALIKFKALDILRKKRASKEIPTEDIYTAREEEGFASDGEEEYEKVWQKMILYSLVLDLKEEMDPIHFQVFFMIALQGRKPQEVALICNIKPNTASQIVSRTTKKLHENFEMLRKENPLESMTEEELLAKTHAVHKEYHAIEKEYAELMR